MAFQKSLDTNFGMSFPQGYHLIGAFEHQIIGQSVSFGVVSYADAAHRNAAKQNMQTYVAVFNVYATKRAAWQAAAEGPAREAAYLDQLVAQQNVKNAEAGVNATQPLPLPLESYNLTGADYVAVLDANGEVSRAKVYTWLKQQTKWIDSSDV